MVLKRLFLKIALCIAYIILSCSNASAYNSMLEYENNMPPEAISYLSSIKECISLGKTMAAWVATAEMSNTSIPKSFSKEDVEEYMNSPGTNTVVTAAIARSAMYAVGYANFPIGTIAALFAMGIEIMIMLHLCNDVYVIEPHEWLNYKRNTLTCELDTDSQQIVNKHPDALTAEEVPFFFTCDPNWDSSTQTSVLPGSADEYKIGKMWGYVSQNSSYCTNGKLTPEDLEIMKPLIGYLPFVVHGDFFINSSSGRTRCEPEADEVHLAVANNEIITVAGIEYATYYRQDDAGKVKMCVGTPGTLTPLRLGCGGVAPPSEAQQLDQALKDYVAGTRCESFIFGRQDLVSLGTALGPVDEDGHRGKPVKEFLRSDFHITSTVVGCIKDMLLRVMINPQNLEGYGSTPFFQKVQDGMRKIVLAALVLYVTLLGIKVMSNPQLPNRGEVFMYIMKFVLVSYFTYSAAWYEVKDGEPVGLLPTLFNASEEIAAFFLQAQNETDPIGYCRYKFMGAPLLDQRSIPASSAGGVPTSGSLSQVKLTVWDLVDCKLVNYLNLGSCNYSLPGIIGGWIMGAAFFSGTEGFLLTLVAFIYCSMLLFVIFKFTHIFIMAAFVIAVLAIISPIVFCFALFEPTKQIFQTWMRMMLGYVLYPALLMAFIALMLGTFDAAFYGTLRTDQGIEFTAESACKKSDGTNIDSVSCATMRLIGADPCTVSPTDQSKRITHPEEISLIGEMDVVNGEVLTSYLNALLRLMLFVVLFYFFMGSVSGFLEILVGVQGLSNLAIGTLSAPGAVGRGLASTGAGVASLANAVRGKSDGDDKKDRSAAEKSAAKGGDSRGDSDL